MPPHLPPCSLTAASGYGLRIVGMIIGCDSLPVPSLGRSSYTVCASACACGRKIELSTMYSKTKRSHKSNAQNNHTSSIITGHRSDRTPLLSFPRWQLTPDSNRQATANFWSWNHHHIPAATPTIQTDTVSSRSMLRTIAPRETEERCR